ncbi:hypothetical protein AMTRI_Chr08g206720 [Amborella trichopoda]
MIMANRYMYADDTRRMKSITGEDFEEEDKKSRLSSSRHISSAFRTIPRSSSGVALEQRIMVQQQSIYKNKVFKCNHMDDNNGNDGEESQKKKKKFHAQ